MTTDTELLEKAALAAGYEVKSFVSPKSGQTQFLIGAKYWNPLENDADAFRLMVDAMLSLEIPSRSYGPGIVKAGNPGKWLFIDANKRGGDMRIATRHAIVKAAAAKAAASREV